MRVTAKPSKQAIIDAIILEIGQGKERGKVLSKYVKKWQISDRTFDRYWKKANEQHKELQDKAKQAADEAYIQESANAAKDAVMSKAERLEILSKIARGQINVKIPGTNGEPDTEEPVLVETLERIKAIGEINKMEGDYAPVKTANTNKNGEDVVPPLTNDQYQALLNKINAGS